MTDILLNGVAKALLAAAVVLAASILVRRSHPSWRCSVLRAGFWLVAIAPFTFNTSGFAARIPAEVPSLSTTGVPDALWVRLLVAVWISGVIVLSAPLLRDVAGLLWILRRSKPLDDRVLIAPDIDVPFTSGMRKPKIVLPEAALGWPASRLESVMLHESAHISRLDWPQILLMRLAGVLLWPNFLLPLISKRAALACEEACDRQVLSQGADPTEYASSLLLLATGGRVRFGTVAAGMAKPGMLENRLRSILHPPRVKHPRRIFQWGAAAAFLLAIGGLCGCRLLPSVVTARPMPTYLSLLLKHGGAYGGPGTTVSGSWTDDGVKRTVTLTGPVAIIGRGGNRAPLVLMDPPAVRR